MKIYCVHSTAFDFVNDFYGQIRSCQLFDSYELIFPHLPGGALVHSRSIIADCDLVLAEVSYPSTGMGIELGWADSAGKPIIAVHKDDAKISSSIKMVAKHVIRYTSMADVGKFLVDYRPSLVT